MLAGEEGREKEKERERHTHGRYNREHFDVKRDEYVPSGNKLQREQSSLVWAYFTLMLGTGVYGFTRFSL